MWRVMVDLHLRNRIKRLGWRERRWRNRCGWNAGGGGDSSERHNKKALAARGFGKL